MSKKSILRDRSFTFAISIVNLYKEIIETKKEYVMSRQLLRCGTSIGANIREARNAESRNDFVHKLGISQKEADETIYWLDLLRETQYLNKEVHWKMANEATQILNMIRSSILTSKENTKKL